MRLQSSRLVLASSADSCLDLGVWPRSVIWRRAWPPTISRGVATIPSVDAVSFRDESLTSEPLGCDEAHIDDKSIRDRPEFPKQETRFFAEQLKARACRCYGAPYVLHLLLLVNMAFILDAVSVL